jgi:SH3 domain-containing YSC84-like protein 1
MTRKLFAILLSLAVAPALFAQKKEAQRLDKSAKALQEIVSSDRGLRRQILDQAFCVLVYPSVKKVAFGIGDSYGRGALVCRKGQDMKGQWGAPSMYSLDRGSLGVQLGSTATDFVLVVVSQKGVEQILKGNAKLGTNAAAAAGPSGAEATSYNAAASKVDVLTYSRSKGLFAGVSLEGASMAVDDDANRNLYGKDLTATEIVKGDTAIPPAATALVDLLDTVSYAHI